MESEEEVRPPLTIVMTGAQQRRAAALAAFRDRPLEEREEMRRRAEAESFSSWANIGFDGGVYDTVDDCIARMLDPTIT